MIVRHATEADLDGVLDIANREVREGVAHFGSREYTLDLLRPWIIAQEKLPFLVAIDDAGQTLGYARASRWKEREAYDWAVEIGVYVSPDTQGQGVGRSLYEALFPQLDDLGYRTIIAGISLPNPASVRLHESFGMKLIGTFPRIGFKRGRWIDVAYWVRNLGEGPPVALSTARR